MTTAVSFQTIWDSVMGNAPDDATEAQTHAWACEIWDAQQASDHPYSYRADADADADAGTDVDADFLIVTRHAGTVAWLSRQGITGPVLAEATLEDVAGKVVIGNLPMHLAALAAQVGIVEFPGLGRGRQGRDLTPEEMDAAEACIRWYVVEIIE